MKRCAIYTRKSTEEGLEQDFNSLHAQREACEAYIKSQRHEGWKLVRTKFNDGGFSGGTMNRPALQDLLAAIERGEVDVIVVYKVDRLTRALSDFAKIVDLLDSKGVSFVSVTQQFNTTSSMGRLTLNVLLSFAQFEREVTAERIRDKIAASKKKGMWMGGPLPLGYDVNDRKLIINKPEAKTVRTLFKMYIELGTVRSLKEEADKLDIVTKHRVQKNGKQTGGKPFARGNLYQLLSNPLYNGCIPHKGKIYSGLHDAIIDEYTWDTVQSLLAENASNRTATTNTHGPFLLSGKVFDEDGEPLYQSQAHKQGKRYAYYISKHLMHGANKRNEGWRLPTATLEDAVILPLKNYLQDQAGLMDALYLKEHSPVVLSKLKTQSARVTHQITDGEFQEKRSILQTIIERVDLSSNTITLTINTEGLAETLDIACPENTDPISITIPIRLRRRGVEAKLIIQGSNAELSNVDTNLCRLVAQAKNWFDQLASGKFATVLDIAQHENTPASEITRILPLAFLAPSLVEDILNGQQAHGVTVYNLKRLSPLPLNWKSQTKTLDSLA